MSKEPAVQRYLAEFGILLGSLVASSVKVVGSSLNKIADLMKKEASPGEMRRELIKQFKDKGESSEKATQIADELLKGRGGGLGKTLVDEATKQARPDSLVGSGIRNLGGAGTAYAGTAPVVTGGLLGATQAEPGERIEGSIGGTVAGYLDISRNPWHPQDLLALVGY